MHGGAQPDLQSAAGQRHHAVPALRDRGIPIALGTDERAADAAIAQCTEQQ